MESPGRYTDSGKTEVPTEFDDGADDEEIDAEALRLLFAASAPRAQVTVLPGINHFGIFSASTALEQTTACLNGF